jgi:hypothetical protein
LLVDEFQDLRVEARLKHMVVNHVVAGALLWKMVRIYERVAIRGRCVRIVPPYLIIHEFAGGYIQIGLDDENYSLFTRRLVVLNMISTHFSLMILSRPGRLRVDNTLGTQRHLIAMGFFIFLR